jgi:hypothetical protein
MIINSDMDHLKRKQWFEFETAYLFQIKLVRNRFQIKLKHMSVRSCSIRLQPYSQDTTNAHFYMCSNMTNEHALRVHVYILYFGGKLKVL